MVNKKPNDAELRALKKNDPAAFEDAVRIEEEESQRLPPAEVVPSEVPTDNWVLVENGFVTQMRPYQQDKDYIQAPAEVVPGFVFKDGVFSLPVHDAETIWHATRTLRDRLLAASDWTQLPDAPLTDAKKEKWKAYRAELRALPESGENPEEVTWPKQPV